MKQTRYSFILIIAVISTCLLAGCKQVIPVQLTTVPEPCASVQNTPLPVVSEEAPLPSGMTVYDTFLADLDGNGISEKIIVGGTLDECNYESIWLNVFDGYDLIKAEEILGYFTSAFLTRTQSGEYCMFISVDRASEDYETDIFSFNGFEPVLRNDVGGHVSIVSGTHITMEDDIDALGSWYYYQEFLLIDSFDLKPATDCVITMGTKGPLRTIKNLPVEMLVNNAYKKQILGKGILIYPVSTDSASYMIFKLENGSEGKISFSFKDYTLCIDGKSEDKYFDNIEYWD